jgi:site-specific DNA recombinase
VQKKSIRPLVLSTARANIPARRAEENHSNKITNGVIYCRVSSKEQVEGTSLETQEVACKDYAQTHDIKVLKIFVERGESAKVADRTQLVELIDFCRTNKTKVQALIVWKLDRFARNVGDHFSIKATLLKYGVRVVSVTEPIDANPEGKLMEAILAGFAQFDNDIRAARTVQGMRRKIQEGIFPWKPPLGYQSAAREGVKKTQPDEPDQPVFGLLQKAWKEFATGTYRKADILRLMHSWGVQTRNGVSMTPQSLDNLFSNPFYAGILTDPWSGEEYMGKHVPMVSAEEFRQVQAIGLRHGRSISHRKEREEFPLRGLARCTVCRQSVTGGFSRGRSKRYAYYHCGNRQCPVRPSYPAHTLHDEFGSFLDQIAPKAEVLSLLGERITEVAEKRQLEWTAQRDRKKAELGRLENEIQELIRMKAQGLISDQEFTRSKVKLSERQLVFADMALPNRFDAKSISAALKEITRPLAELKVTWRSLPPGFQRRFNHLVLPVGFVIREYRTAELGPMFRFLGGTDDANSHEVAFTGESLNPLCEAIQAFADLFREVEEEKKAA